MTREQLLEGLQERMKKYAELVGSDKLENHTYHILDDLKAAVHALEVAREALHNRNYSISQKAFDDADKAIRLIDQTLGKAGV